MSASKLRRACYTFGRNKIALGFPEVLLMVVFVLNDRAE